MSAAPARPKLVRNPAPAVAIAGQPAPAAVPVVASVPDPEPQAAETTEEAQELTAGQQPRPQPADGSALPGGQDQVPVQPPAAESSARVVSIGVQPPAEAEETAEAEDTEAAEGEAAPPADAGSAEVPAPACWDKVTAAGFSAKRESRSWTPYTPRLPESTWSALEARKLADARRTGDYGIAVAHYLQVAFDGLPRVNRAARIAEAERELADARRTGKPEAALLVMTDELMRAIPADGAVDARAAARAGLDWLQKIGGRPGALVPTGSRIMKSMKAEMQELGLMLKGQQPKVELWVVQAAYVHALLDALEREPLPGAPES